MAGEFRTRAKVLAVCVSEYCLTLFLGGPTGGEPLVKFGGWIRDSKPLIKRLCLAKDKSCVSFDPNTGGAHRAL